MTPLEQAVDYLAGRMPVRPTLAIVLGSGLGEMARLLDDPVMVAYGDVPGFMRSTVPGHAGRLVFGKLEGADTVLMQGRFHYYEGYTAGQVAFPVRALAGLGVDRLLLTNAAGGVNLHFKPGDLMLLTDFINFAGVNPLIGPNDEGMGPRFPDMSEALDPAWQLRILSCAKDLGLMLRTGVYAMMSGPSFETPAEIRMLRTLGADAVGMSTVPEIIAARHSGMRVAAVSCITNMAAGVLKQPITHAEVLETGSRARERFERLIRRIAAER